MIIQALVEDTTLKDALKELLKSNGMKCYLSQNVESLLEKSMERLPRAIILEENSRKYLQTIDTIRDLRNLFGSVITIILIGKGDPKSRLMGVIDAGADNYFSYPFDVPLFEDFLSKSTKKEVFHSFKYRHVPSGETPISIKQSIFVTQISTDGITFESKTFIGNGTILSLDISELIDIHSFKVCVKILSSYHNKEGNIVFFAEFHDMEPETREKLTHQLKTPPTDAPPLGD